MTKRLNWFEIPAADLDRACRFYESLFGIPLRRGEMAPWSLAVFPYDEEKSAGGCLIAGEGLKPSLDGAVLYLNADEPFDTVFGRIVPLGGRITMPRTELPGIGLIAHFTDTEGPM